LKKGALKGGIDVIKLATHRRNMRKDVINKYVKTTNYNTVVFNAFAVAIGYMISIKSCNGFMKLPQILSFKMSFAGEKERLCLTFTEI